MTQKVFWELGRHNILTFLDPPKGWDVAKVFAVGLSLYPACVGVIFDDRIYRIGPETTIDDLCAERNKHVATSTKPGA